MAAVLFATLTGLLLIATLLPLSKVPFGTVRGLEFPRMHYFVLSIALFGGILVVQPSWFFGIGWCIALALAAAQLVYIAKFTPIWRPQSTSATPALAANAMRRISVLAANVKKSNRDYDALIELVRFQSPDILLAIEVDEAWITALKLELSEPFAHWIEVPKDNGYGICVLSKLPLDDVEVRDLVTEGVPSVRTAVQLRSGHRVRLYVVHPEPPMPHLDTKGRDSEIAMIGLETAKDPLPCLVAGDLNDVAWSTTTRRFQRLSGLLDPRVGRGFYNTFSATMPWMRWPLDHLFHDPAFRLIEMDRLPKIGSDHFPMWFALALADNDDAGASPGVRDDAETFGSKRMIVEERKRDREPIGQDWEDE